jgi:hypothetical protein
MVMLRHVFVYKKRTALSNGPTIIGPSPTFFHLKPRILFLKCCGIKKKEEEQDNIQNTNQACL